MPPRLLSLIAPPLCGICGDSCAAESPICDHCAAQLAATRPEPLTIPGAYHAWAATPYEGVPRQLVAALKFGKRLALAEVAAQAIAASAPVGLNATVVPAPADPWRHRLRGFDPAAEIAGAVAKHLGLPFRECLARRHVPRQVGKARAERLASRLGIRAKGPVPARVLLIDDVSTTGTTLSECALRLRSNGAGEIVAFAFARA